MSGNMKYKSSWKCLKYCSILLGSFGVQQTLGSAVFPCWLDKCKYRYLTNKELEKLCSGWNIMNRHPKKPANVGQLPQLTKTVLSSQWPNVGSCSKFTQLHHRPSPLQRYISPAEWAALHSPRYSLLQQKPPARSPESGWAVPISCYSFFLENPQSFMIFMDESQCRLVFRVV